MLTEKLIREIVKDHLGEDFGVYLNEDTFNGKPVFIFSISKVTESGVSFTKASPISKDDSFIAFKRMLDLHKEALTNPTKIEFNKDI